MVLNPFETDAFNMVSLTHAINILPNNYGRLRELDIFPDKGITTRVAMVEEMNGVLNLLSTMPVGAPEQINRMGKRKVRAFSVPHIPLSDVILAAEFEAVREFGTENQVQTLATVVNNHMQSAKNKYAITLEHLRMGALKGIILDADGSLLYNLYTEFGIEQNFVDFELDSATTDVRAKCMQVLRLIEDNLRGEVMTQPRALVSADFFDALTGHASVKATFDNTVMAAQVLGGDIRKGFAYGGIVFEEYRGTATDATGATRKFIADGEGHCFPQGTMDTFKTIYAPADFLETVNTVGIPLYAKQEVRQYNRGINLHIQSNPLPMCFRPGVLVKLVS
jgi:hypothetical protein